MYSLAWYLLAPAVAAAVLWLGFRDPAWRHGLRERLGLIRAASPRGLWVHAASVGEVQATLPLVQALRLEYPDLPITLTTFTPSGRDHALRQLPNGVRCALLPFDLPGASRRFVERLRPRAAVVVETEIWPNLYRACERAGVPMIVVSARITERAHRAYARIRPLIAGALAVPAVISAQTDADAERIQSLGAEPTRVTVGGNIKFDFRLPDGIDGRIAALRDELEIGGRPVWIAASTHDGEDGPALDAHRAVLAAHHDALLLLAPRHPGRADAVCTLTRARGFRYARRSDGGAVGDAQVFVVDTLGELVALYGTAHAAFIGGTLVPVGGHNLLEPAAFSLPILCGPHVHSIARMHALMLEAGGVVPVGDAAGLGSHVSALLKEEALRARVGAAARGVLERNRGAVERAIRLISSTVR